jgi:hypothetical protein
MRPRDTTDATRAALGSLGLLADARRLAEADARLAGVINYIDEVPPEQRKRDASRRRGKIKGALDPLGHLLAQVIRVDPYMQAKDVLKVLTDRAKKHDPVVRDVVRSRRGIVEPRPLAARGRRARPPRGGLVVVWYHAKTGKTHKTAWSSIQRGRLALVRKLVRDKNQ